MSKELTEQWRNGTLKEGVYWCEVIESPYVEQVHLPCCEDIVVEVLAPVPSFDEYNELMQKIHKLEKQLSRIVKEKRRWKLIVQKFFAIKKLKEDLDVQKHVY